MAVKYLLDFPHWTSPFKWAPGENLFFIGSCFAESVSSKFRDLGLDVLSNPFGVVYNPHSIARQLERIASLDPPQSASFYHDQGLYNDWDSSHRYSMPAKEALMQKLMQDQERAKSYLSTSQVAIITLGTAWVHELKVKPYRIVSNCHKAPAALFSKRMLSSAEIAESLHRIEKALRSIQPDIDILYTLSPVRYLREGLRDSFLAKATLRTEIQKVLNTPEHYFPAYEILIDCLRDYRFYAQDMLHPSAQSVELIYRFFLDHIIAPNQCEVLELLEKYQKLKSHKILQKETPNARILQDLDKLAAQLGIKGIDLRK